MIETVFGNILHDTVKNTPGAVGGGFVASDGESVDDWSLWEREEWAILLAHFAILVRQVRSALLTFHFGDLQILSFSYRDLDVAVELVMDGYFSLLAVESPEQLEVAQRNLSTASEMFRKELR